MSSIILPSGLVILELGRNGPLEIVLRFRKLSAVQVQL